MAVPDAFDADVANVAFAPSTVAAISSAIAAAFEAVVVAAAVVALAPLDAHAVVAPAVAEDGPPLPPRIEDQSSLANLELRVEK